MGVTEELVALAQGGTPSFDDVSFPVDLDSSQRTDLLQRDPDTSVFSFSGDAQKELAGMPPLSQVQVRVHLEAAGNCLAGKDYPGCTSHMLMAKAVARRFDAEHLRQEIDNRMQEVADHANGTHEASYAERHVDREFEQSSPAVEDLRQGPNTPLSRVISAHGAVQLAMTKDYERFEHGREEHVSGHMDVLRQMVEHPYLGQLRPSSYGLLGSSPEVHEEMNNMEPDSHGRRGAILMSLRHAEEKIKAGTRSGSVKNDLLDAAVHAQRAGMPATHEHLMGHALALGVRPNQAEREFQGTSHAGGDMGVNRAGGEVEHVPRSTRDDEPNTRAERRIWADDEARGRRAMGVGFSAGDSELSLVESAAVKLTGG